MPKIFRDRLLGSRYDNFSDARIREIDIGLCISTDSFSEARLPIITGSLKGTSGQGTCGPVGVSSGRECQRGIGFCLWAIELQEVD